MGKGSKPSIDTRYDGMNRVTGVTYYTGGGPADSFHYYLDGELNTATVGNPSHNLTYNLDNKGNRTSVVDNNVTSTYTPNPNDQYTTGAGLSVTNGLEHEIQVFNGVTYGYINDERLSSVASGSATYSMVYDALGRCMKRSITGGPSTYYIYDGDKPILEYDATSGTSVGVNLYGKGIDEILERVAAGSVYFPQQNHEGSVTLLTDSNGNVLERYRYDAFGAATIYTPTWGTRSSTLYDNRFLFTGREYAVTYRSTTNAAFNFYEYRARAYNPKLGRFTSEDPKLFGAGDYNLFRYCHNDPVDMTDPMGLQDQDFTGLAPREVSRRLADEQYGNIMAAAQMNTSAGAIGVAALAGTITAQLQQQALGSSTAGQAAGASVRQQPAREGRGSESWRDEHAQATLDQWASLAYDSRREVAGTMNSNGQSFVGPASGRYPTKSDPGPVTADSVAMWHFHHLLPGTAPYRFSFPNDQRMIQQYPNLSHYVGVLNAPAGHFTIFGYTPETPYFHYIRPGPQPFPQPPSY